MKHIPKLVLSLVYTLSLTLPLFGTQAALAAGSGTIYLSPASGSYGIGSTINVNVYENSGSTTVNATHVVLNYNSSLLSYVSIASSSAFNVSAPSSGGGGTVSIDRGAFTALSGAQVVATVSFKALAAGTASVTVNTGSSTLNQNDGSATNILGSATGASFTIPAPASPPPPSPTPPSPTPTPAPSPSTPPAKPSPTPQPTASPTPSTPATSTRSFTIQNVQVSDTTFDSATISWQTSVAATSEVYYGQDGNYILSKIDSAKTTSHSQTVKADPGQLYHFIVKGTDASGGTAVTQDATFHTKGASVTFSVVGQDGKPIKGAKVVIQNKVGDKLIEEYSGITDEKGEVTLANLPASQGSSLVLGATVTYNGKTQERSVEVEPLSSGDQQNVKVAMSVSSVNKNLLLYAISGLVLLSAIVGSAIFISRRNARMNDLNHHFPNLPSGGYGSPPNTTTPTITPSAGSTTSNSNSSSSTE